MLPEATCSAAFSWFRVTWCSRGVLRFESGSSRFTPAWRAANKTPHLVWFGSYLAGSNLPVTLTGSRYSAVGFWFAGGRTVSVGRTIFCPSLPRLFRTFYRLPLPGLPRHFYSQRLALLFCCGNMVLPCQLWDSSWRGRGLPAFAEQRRLSAPCAWDSEHFSGRRLR